MWTLDALKRIENDLRNGKLNTSEACEQLEQLIEQIDGAVPWAVNLIEQICARLNTETPLAEIVNYLQRTQKEIRHHVANDLRRIALLVGKLQHPPREVDTKNIVDQLNDIRRQLDALGDLNSGRIQTLIPPLYNKDLSNKEKQKPIQELADAYIGGYRVVEEPDQSTAETLITPTRDATPPPSEGRGESPAYGAPTPDIEEDAEGDASGEEVIDLAPGPAPPPLSMPSRAPTPARVEEVDEEALFGSRTPDLPPEETEEDLSYAHRGPVYRFFVKLKEWWNNHVRSKGSVAEAQREAEELGVDAEAIPMNWIIGKRNALLGCSASLLGLMILVVGLVAVMIWKVPPTVESEPVLAEAREEATPVPEEPAGDEEVAADPDEASETEEEVAEAPGEEAEVQEEHPTEPADEAVADADLKPEAEEPLVEEPTPAPQKPKDPEATKVAKDAKAPKEQPAKTTKREKTPPSQPAGTSEPPRAQTVSCHHFDGGICLINAGRNTLIFYDVGESGVPSACVENARQGEKGEVQAATADCPERKRFL